MRVRKIHLTHEEVKKRFRYEDGFLFWANKQRRKSHPDKITYKNRSGYIVVHIDHAVYFAHRIIWFLVHGVEPEVIDHINRNPSDNRIENLRSVTTQINALNKEKLGPHGLCRGVYWNTSYKRYSVYIERKIDGKTFKKNVANTHDYFDACCARLSAENAFESDMVKFCQILDKARRREYSPRK